MAAPVASPQKFLLFLTISCIFIPSRVISLKDIFSTKTAYKWVFDIDKPVVENDFLFSRTGGDECVAVNAQVFLRHGARYPGEKDIRKMSALHQKLRLVTTNEGFSFLKDWENHFPEIAEKTLVDEGEEEHYLLGSRFAKRLLKIFNKSVKNVRFISSSKERCIDSAKAFYEGFTEVVLDEAYDNMTPEINDDILRFHTKCTKFITTVDSNRTFLSTYKKFKSGPEMLNVARSIENRLGIKHAKLDPGELKLIYFLCTFEKIILDKDDWCKMMTDEEREVLEYHNDMKQYYKKAYGHPVIAKMACPLVQTVFSALDKTLNSMQNNRKQRGDVATFYFGHTESLAPLYAALALFNDSIPPTHTNFNEMKNRQFKSSQILPFSANIALVLYNCNQRDNGEAKEEDFVLRMFVNEKPVQIPACGEYVCSYAAIRKFYVHHIEGCDFEKSCHVDMHDEL